MRLLAEPMSARSVVAAAATAVSIAALPACSGYLDGRAEQALREALPRVVGPAESYEVAVTGASADAARFDRVRVTGKRVARENAPVLDRVELELRGVAVDREAKRLSAVAEASGSVRIAAGDLADYLQRRGWIDEPTVVFAPPDRIEITGTPRIAGIAVGVRRGAEFRGRLRADGTKLRLTVDHLALGARETPALARAIVERAINPIFDAAPYPVPERIDALVVEADAVRIAASGSRLAPERAVSSTLPEQARTGR